MESDSIRKYLHFSHPTNEQVIELDALDDFVKEDNHHDFLIPFGALGIPPLKWQYTAVTRGIKEIEKF